MLGPEFLFMVVMVTIVILAFVLFVKMEKGKDLQKKVEKLQRSLDEMDEQAKLIVRTDMELNKTQEELDKKMTGLYALQKLSRVISTTLEESQVLKNIGADYLEELGFEKALIFSWDETQKKFVLGLHIGFAESELRKALSFVEARQSLLRSLIAHEKAFSSFSLAATPKDLEDIQRELVVKSFIISPVLPKEGNRGFFFVGTERGDTIISDGDEELINILSNQLGQALENARLFEKTWRAQQELEKKVEERTRELSRALEEVKSISRRKTDFVSSVSHELRTPLTSIKGYAAILLTGKLGHLPEDIHERLDKINLHSDELVHMVNDLLDISRIESGKVTMRQEPLDLRKIVEKIGDLLSVQLKAKDVQLRVDLPLDAIDIFVDRVQIERVFINIIGNAIKFTPMQGTISVRSRTVDQKTIQVDIADTGCGLPPEAQEKIFEEFYRVENAINEQVKGTGLGLSLVKRIIDAHGGSIGVKSKEGAGSTFTFTLPRPQ